MSSPASDPMLKPRPSLDRSVTALGWFSWGYTVIFAPITQMLFLAANWSRPEVGAARKDATVQLIWQLCCLTRSDQCLLQRQYLQDFFFSACPSKCSTSSTLAILFDTTIVAIAAPNPQNDPLANLLPTQAPTNTCL